MPEGIPDEYLDIVMTCPVPQGQEAGAQSLRDVLASEIGPKITPHIVENIRNAQELEQSGIDPERAVIIAFGGAIVKDETGGILREPEIPEPAEQTAGIARHLEPALQGAEKK